MQENYPAKVFKVKKCSNLEEEMLGGTKKSTKIIQCMGFSKKNCFRIWKTGKLLRRLQHVHQNYAVRVLEIKKYSLLWKKCLESFRKYKKIIQ